MKNKFFVSLMIVPILLISAVITAPSSYAVYSTCGPLNQQLQINLPGLAMDPLGNLYLSDESNGYIRKYEFANEYKQTVYAGSGANGAASGDGALAINATFNQARKLAWNSFDSSLLFLDFQNKRIRRIDSSGNISTIYIMHTHNIGKEGNGTYANNKIQTFAVNSLTGDIFAGIVPTTYSPSYGGQIVKIPGNYASLMTPANSSTGYAAIATNLVDAVGTLNGPSSMAVGSDGTVYVGNKEASNPVISSVSSSGTVTDFYKPGVNSSQATALTFDESGNLWASIAPDVTPHFSNILKFRSSGLAAKEAPLVMVSSSSLAQLAKVPNNNSSFRAIVVDSTKGGLFVTDNVSHSIQQVSSLTAPNQSISLIAGLGSAGAACQTGNPISVTQSPGGAISPGSTLVASAGSQKFTFTPISGYDVTSITVDGAALSEGALATAITPTGYTFSDVVTAHTISATFTAPSRIITVTTGSNGTISPGTTTVSGGSNQTFTFAPSSGYSVASITIDGTALSGSALTSAISGGYTFSNVVAVHTVAATFALTTYAITVTSGSNGTISPDSATVTPGDNQLFTFTPLTNYSVASITIDGTALSGSTLTSAISSGYTFSNVVAVHTVTATYALITYAITVTQGSNGTISPDTTTVGSGTNQAFTFTPATNYSVASITIDGTALSGAALTSAISSGYTFSNVVAVHTVTATYALITYVTTVTQTSNGTISPGTTTVGSGTNQAFTFTPSTGYSVASITIDGTALSGSTLTSAISGGYTFSNVVAVHTVTATWSHNQYTVTFDKNNTSATGTMAVQSKSAATDLAANAFALVNNSFLSWNTAANGTGTRYIDLQSYTFVVDTTLYAQWGSVITYSTVGADSGTPTRSSENWSSGAITSLPTVGSMVKAGYTFGGWSNGVTTYTTTYTPTTGITLNPVWTANTYTVSFNKNGASTGAVPSDQTWSQSTTALTLSGNTGTLAKPGYSFGGWAVSASAPQSAITTFSSTSNTLTKTLYAIWTPVSYTVTYNLNSGTSTLPTEINHNINDTFTVAATPTRDTYIFGGWSNGSTTYQAGSSYSVSSSDITLTAKWVATYTVNYVMNGSVDTPEGDALYESGIVITTAVAPSRTGYTFGYWLASNSLTPVAGANFTVIANSTLTATWTPVAYTVTYALGGGTSTLPTHADVNINNTFNLPSTNPTKAGYLFNDWSDGSKTYGAGASYVVGSANITLTAQWTIISYTVTYGLGGGVGTLPTHANVNITNTFTVSTETDPTWLAHTFVGWNDGALDYAKSNTYTTGSSNITLTAVWTLNGYTKITYALGGGSGTLPTQTALIEGSSFTVASGSGLAKSGQAFIGWNDTTSTFQLNDIHAVGSYTVPIVLTAQWDTGYSVTYSAGTGSGTVPTDALMRITGTSFTLSDGSTLSRSGYTFAGWSDGVTTSLGGTSRTIGSANLIFIAQWTLIVVPARPVEPTPVVIVVPVKPVEPTPVVIVVPKLTPAEGLSSPIVAAEIDLIENQSRAKDYFMAIPKPVVNVATQSSSSPRASQINSVGVLTSINTQSATTNSLETANFNLPATEIVLSDLVVKSLELKVKLVATDSGFSVKPVAGFTGVLVIPVVATIDGVQITVLNRVVVNPVAPVAIGFTPKSEKESSISWSPSASQVVAYVVEVNGKTLCQTTFSSCPVPTLIGPNSKVTISALGNDQTSSETKVIPYVAKAPIPALTVAFAANSSRLSSAQKSELRKIAEIIDREGFTRLVVSGFTDAQGTAAANKVLSAARAKATAAFLTQLLPDITIKSSGYGANNPVKTGKSITAYEANRRCEISVW